MTTPSAPSASVEQDYFWMAQAIRLAQKGDFTTSPNPRVGCIILNHNGDKVGEGWHLRAGSPHAEVYALHQAGEQAIGGTAYVTLEPCSHHGRTPPCAQALIAANVQRVVVAMTDPNPQVSGRGLQMLQQAGIEVTCDILAAEAARLNPGFIKRMIKAKPWVTVKLAISLDGKIALANGKSQWITGPEARQDVQRYRARSCAVLTGSGTARTDNPSLLVRPQQANIPDYPLPDIRQPVRVVLDNNKALSPDLQLFTDGHITWRVTANTHILEANDIPVDSIAGKLDIGQMLEILAAKNINQLFVEAGPGLAGALLEAQEVDELVIYQAPKILGHHAQSMVRLADFSSLSEAIDLRLQSQRMIGNDLKMVFQVVSTTN
ncbi:bifunctional diaminohydroxyphosphoribosylaminopyrimidine deaminase/5-amino-6-(5-phosphoribosylamino)uracil reductase RibD [Salinimonas chungwhensis]|uniref:bifunctional diaminohydroxyphosphoribosylaminopyrimidine deaminase/5-amino-6-(5-phosphoribosylamino)uracil reductase RibD n=1 Tax=Salinimonas chungwhensis TaxID=265425 RepID=UPI0003802705|nr:bifunctional diaminohydroxyphosphoribosylaminopyrimidine deaminase/5-amino-6-(5-phosphoribosylamino)uracil reductase RibD [Salinimonas chungwhensis]